MRIVVALGGNALLRRGERPDAALQECHVREADALLMLTDVANVVRDYGTPGGNHGGPDDLGIYRF